MGEQLFDFVVDKAQRIGWALAVLGAAFVFIREWVLGLDGISQIFVAIAVVGLLLMGLGYFLDWRKKRSIDNLPELLSKIDQVALDFIDDFEPKSDQPETLLDDLATILHWDATPLKNAMKSKNKKQIQQQVQVFAGKYDRLIDPKKQTQDTLRSLLQMDGILNEYNAGSENITKTKEYKKLFKKIRIVQKRAPTAEISAKVNDYFCWSQGLYCVLLSAKPVMGQREVNDLIPADLKAMKRMLRPLIERNTATLISAVHESIEKSKRKDKK